MSHERTKNSHKIHYNREYEVHHAS
jgi:hypothetical protein